MPDIKVEHEKNGLIVLALLSKYFVFNYATKYWMKHKDIGPVKEFKLKDEDYEEFLTDIKSKDYSYKTKSENEFEELKKQATEESIMKILKQNLKH